MANYLQGRLCPLCHGYVHGHGDGIYKCEDCGYEMEYAKTIDASYVDAE